ncbi:LicD family protein [Shewanella cyperi]|uniref:LicD family protein n=1 Tax=Shewanella cyperi TaxID=2814292 RepID=A0A974XKS0_9GAMM|nr:LicD family protein [Shewanella cyperi]QSX30201.1 LicD family protein [Shewanella cyperi]
MAFSVKAPRNIFPPKGGKSLDHSLAEDLLLAIAAELDAAGIVYHLEGGTLLGLVRDGHLLPWDKDLDISVAAVDIDRAYEALQGVTHAGWRLKRKCFKDSGELALKGTRIIKVEDRSGGMLRSGHDYLDIIAKAKVRDHVYWQVKDSIMRVCASYYDGFEEIAFRGVRLKVPVNYRDYLTEKYGNWHQVIREWDCARDEKCRLDTPHAA